MQNKLKYFAISELWNIIQNIKPFQRLDEPKSTRDASASNCIFNAHHHRLDSRDFLQKTTATKIVRIHKSSKRTHPNEKKSLTLPNSISPNDATVDFIITFCSYFVTNIINFFLSNLLSNEVSLYLFRWKEKTNCLLKI